LSGEPARDPHETVLERLARLITRNPVAAMPNWTGKHYYFEILLSGSSILGAVAGFAKQQYKGGTTTARASS
jgi:hypothetical protein